MKIHLYRHLEAPTTLWVVYNRKEIFRTTIQPEDKFIEVAIPQAPGFTQVFVDDNGKSSFLWGIRFKNVTIEDTDRLRAEAKQLFAEKRFPKAKGKLMEAEFILQTFAEGSSQQAETLEELALADLGIRCRPMNKYLYVRSAAASYQKALDIWSARGDTSATARCQSQLSALKQILSDIESAHS